MYLTIHTLFPGSELFDVTFSNTLNFEVSGTPAAGKAASDCQYTKSVSVLEEKKSRFASVNISTSEYSVHTSGLFETAKVLTTPL